MNFASKNKTMTESEEYSAEDLEKYAGPKLRCVLFQLENEVFGIDVKKIREVLRVKDIRRVEGADAAVLGIINVRGVIVTVVDMALMQSMNAQTINDLSRIIIVELDEEYTVGMLVEKVIEVKDIPEVTFQLLSGTKEEAPRYLKAISHYEGQVIVLLDINYLFEGKH